MLIEDEIVKVKISKRNSDWYELYGSVGDTVEVPAIDVDPQSTQLVPCRCNRCDARFHAKMINVSRGKAGAYCAMHRRGQMSKDEYIAYVKNVKGLTIELEEWKWGSPIEHYVVEWVKIVTIAPNKVVKNKFALVDMSQRFVDNVLDRFRRRIKVKNFVDMSTKCTIITESGKEFLAIPNDVYQGGYKLA